MPQTESNSPELLRQAILDAAGREVERILTEARRAADAVVAAAEQEAGRVRESRMAAARAEAERRRSALQAATVVESNRRRAALIEELLQAVHDGALAQLRKDDAHRQDAIERLAAEAASRMTGDAFVLRLPGAELDALRQGREEAMRQAVEGVRPCVKLRLVRDESLKAGDWVLQDEEGHQVWRLGLEARLARLWPELRREVARRAGLLDLET